MKEKKNWKKPAAVVLLVLLAAGAVWLWKYVGGAMVQFVRDPEQFRVWVDEKGAWSRVVFVAMTVFQILIALIPGEPFEIAAGYAFGAWEGTALCIVSCLIGSLLTFLLVRKFGIRLVRVFFSEEQIASARFLKSSPRRDLLFLVVYMLPGTPKDLLGYFAGLTEMRLPVWLVICSFGRIPSVVTSTVGGSALGSGDYRMAAIVFVVTMAISGLGVLIYNRFSQRREAK